MDFKTIIFALIIAVMIFLGFVPTEYMLCVIEAESGDAMLAVPMEGSTGKAMTSTGMHCHRAAF